MNKSLFKLFSLLVIGSLMTAACGMLAPTANVELQQQITQTMQAVATSVQSTLQAAVPTTAPATDTPLPTDTPAPTDTPLPTDTPAPTETPKPTKTPIPYVYPTYTPAPIPTTEEPSTEPVYSLDYYRLETCSPNWTPAIKIKNNGDSEISSYSISIKDKDTSTTTTASSNDFSKRSGCSTTNEITSLDPGDTGYIYGANLDYDPSDHNMKATITACYKNDLKGKCTDKTINFTP
jgi:outer membrane biosynthesis protein TonB